MTHVANAIQDSVPGVRVVTAMEDLETLKCPDCAAVLWWRQPNAVFRTWIEGLDPDLLPWARIILRPEQVRETLLELCAEARTPECPERVQFIEDTVTLVTEFAALMDVPFVRLRLDVVENNACRKFHIDYVTARLICTFRGTGTQYGQSVQGADPHTILTVPTGSPIILRGNAWPEQPRVSLRHRSPPIEGTGETRLVLVLDPITKTDPVLKDLDPQGVVVESF